MSLFACLFAFCAVLLLSFFFVFDRYNMSDDETNPAPLLNEVYDQRFLGYLRRGVPCG